MRSSENEARSLVAVPDHPANDLPVAKESRTQRVGRLSLEFRERLLLALIGKEVPETAAAAIVELLTTAKPRDRITILQALLEQALPSVEAGKSETPLVAIQVNGGLQRGKVGQ